MNKSFFSAALLHWYDNTERRNLPWKNGNPYHIWLSEIILQQTRVEQGMPYYFKFTEKYPSITDLANAPEDEILKVWQGLGYYARARNMHRTAQLIRDEYGGQFPDSYEKIRALKGIGDYTAAAIASFAFGLPYAVLDGNVFRVLSRFFGIETTIDSTAGKKQFSELASDLLDRERPGDYNQAIMDLGAIVCKPRSPLCDSCVLSENCKAYLTGTIGELPVKSKKMEKRERFFYYFVWKSPDGKTVIRRREKGDIWQGLYDFPLIESPQGLNNDEHSILWESDIWKNWTKDWDIEKNLMNFSTTYVQLLTHQKILAIFVEISGEIPFYFSGSDQFKTVDIEELRHFALPKTVQQYLETDLFPEG